MKYSRIVSSVAALALFSFSLNASNVPGGPLRKYGENAPEAISGIKIGGFIGSRIDICNSGMIMQEDVDALVEPFRHKDDRSSWSTEFIGKWMLGANLEDDREKAVRLIHFCDFASAGNDWDPCGRYRVWIPRTLHVMSEPYHRY